MDYRRVVDDILVNGLDDQDIKLDNRFLVAERGGFDEELLGPLFSLSFPSSDIKVGVVC